MAFKHGARRSDVKGKKSHTYEETESVTCEEYFIKPRGKRSVAVDVTYVKSRKPKALKDCDSDCESCDSCIRKKKCRDYRPKKEGCDKGGKCGGCNWCTWSKWYEESEKEPCKNRCPCDGERPSEYDDDDSCCSNGGKCEGSCDDYSCGSAHIKWKSKNGCNKYKSKIVSSPNEECLVENIDKKIEFIAGLFNSTTSTDPKVFQYQLAHIGCFAPNTTIISLADTPPNTYIGINANASLFANVFSAIKLAHPNAVLTISYVYRIIANDLVNVTYVLTFTYATMPGLTETTTVTLTTQSHIICCGNEFPPIDLGWVTLSAPPPV